MNKLIEVIKKIATEMIFNETTKEKMIKNLKIISILNAKHHFAHARLLLS